MFATSGTAGVRDRRSGLLCSHAPRGQSHSHVDATEREGIHQRIAVDTARNHCWVTGQSCRSTIKLTMFKGDLEDLASVAHKPSRLGTRESDCPVTADIW